MIRIVISQQPFDAQAELARFAARRAGDSGALASFTGYCRSRGEDGELDALHLDHYPGFTEAEVERLATAVAARHGVDELLVIHRAGEVAPREPIVLVAAMSPHRRAAFDAVSELMDYLKTDAPFWKREVRGETSRWIEPTDLDRSRRNALGE